MEIRELNRQWKAFIEDQRLYLLLEEKDLFDFLYHLTYSNPTHKVQNGYATRKIDVVYTGDDPDIRKGVFNISCREYEEDGRTYNILWMINNSQERINAYHGLSGYFVEEYFSFVKKGKHTVEKLWDMFDMRMKIEEVVASSST